VRVQGTPTRPERWRSATSATPVTLSPGNGLPPEPGVNLRRDQPPISFTKPVPEPDNLAIHNQDRRRDPRIPRTLTETNLRRGTLAPMLRLWNRGSGGGGGGGGASGSGGSGGGGAGRSSGGPRGTVGRVAGPVGRASSIASAYAAGNRQAVEAAGLNYDELRALNDGHQLLVRSLSGTSVTFSFTDAFAVRAAFAGEFTLTEGLSRFGFPTEPTSRSTRSRSSSPRR